MKFQIYRGDEDDADQEGSLAPDISDEAVLESGTLPLLGRHTYIILPSYGPEFRDGIAGYIKLWPQELRDQHRFWASPLGGGILALPPTIRGKPFHRFNMPGDGLGQVYGTVLGNKAGDELANRVFRSHPDRPPGFAVAFFGAACVPEPRVSATVEHVDCLAGERYLLIVPKANRKAPIDLLDQLPEWFEPFGVRVTMPPSTPPPALREEMNSWFDNPERPMSVIKLEGGVPNAAWQLAVTYYVAEHWDVHPRGLDTVHFIANIAGKPQFRKNWTNHR